MIKILQHHKQSFDYRCAKKKSWERSAGHLIRGQSQKGHNTRASKEVLVSLR